MQLAININSGFPETAAENYVLNAKMCVPHITLLMGLISKERLTEIYKKMIPLTKKNSALNLQMTSFTVSSRPDGKVFSAFVIERTRELQKLHEAILDKMSSVFSYDDVRKEMFYSPPPMAEVPLFWTSGRAKNDVGKNYHPHLTLGLGTLKQTPGPIKFKASRLAVCHLGNYCTCRNILWSAELK